MDPLSDIIALLRPHAALSKPISGRGDWGVRYDAYGQPGFAMVLAGIAG
nr:cupin domain-containing protein [Rhizorhabdus wittichii]